jgi:glycosyltransferase involved in cell wall biosynthesis
MVGRLLTYKRFDVAIEAFNKMKKPLTIIGDGPEMKRLKKMANQNIKFLGEVSDDKLRECYQNCQALIFPQEEDFGIVVLEAMACGKPVIAYRGGGALETIKENKTGLFFNKQTPEALIRAVMKFRTKDFKTRIIREQALKFSKQKFKEKIKGFIKEHYNNDHRN